MADWSLDYFEGLAAEAWRRARPQEHTRAEAAFLAQALTPPAKGALLDVPCGEGRLSCALAAEGYRLTGVDASAEALWQAKAEAGNRNVGVDWVQQDMAELPWRAAFDGAFCMGNSFAYRDAAGCRAFLAAVARTLRPGARFVLDTDVAAESVLPNLEPRSWAALGDLYVLTDTDYDLVESRLYQEYTFIRGEEREVRQASLWVFTVGEIQRMLAEQGLTTLHRLAAPDFTPYEYGADRLLLVAEKTR